MILVLCVMAILMLAFASFLEYGPFSQGSWIIGPMEPVKLGPQNFTSNPGSRSDRANHRSSATAHPEVTVNDLLKPWAVSLVCGPKVDCPGSYST